MPQEQMQTNSTVSVEKVDHMVVITKRSKTDVQTMLILTEKEARYVADKLQ